MLIYLCITFGDFSTKGHGCVISTDTNIPPAKFKYFAAQGCQSSTESSASQSMGMFGSI